MYALFPPVQLPLCGYGGASSLEVVGVSSSNDGRSCLELGAVKVACGIKLKVLLYNSGPRAAFVRATCCKLESSTPLPESHAHLVPSWSVIAANSTQEVVLYYRPDPGEEEKCQVGKTPLALLRVQSGDELMRQRLVWADGEGRGKVLDPTCKQFVSDFPQQKKSSPASSGRLAMEVLW